jgi:hypothetical protein
LVDTRPGLPYFFGTTNQNGEKYTKCSQNIPNGNICNLPPGNTLYQNVPCQGLPEYSNMYIWVGIFGMNIGISMSGNPVQDSGSCC